MNNTFALIKRMGATHLLLCMCDVKIWCAVPPQTNSVFDMELPDFRDIPVSKNIWGQLIWGSADLGQCRVSL